MSQTERQILYDLTYMWNLKKKKGIRYRSPSPSQFIDTKDRLVVARGECMRGGRYVFSQNAQTSSYKISQSWGCNIQHCDYS